MQQRNYIYIPTLLVLLFTITLLGCSTNNLNSVEEIPLNTNWKFKKATDNKWLPATVPGTVHTDLINNKLIEDPFYRLNEHDLQWIDKETWEYSTSFTIEKETLNHENIELNFEGIDTYSYVYLNEKLILTSDNMFRAHLIDIKSFAVEGENILRVVLHSPIQKGIEKHDSLNYKIPVSDNDLAGIGKVENEKQVSIFTRKAGYHFGWDWGPRLVTSGIWKPVTLRFWNSHKIEDLNTQQLALTTETATLTAALEVQSNNSKLAKVKILVNNQFVKDTTIDLSTGKNHLKIPFEIQSPQRWWPNGMGKQTLYSIEAKVVVGNYTATKKQRIGLRTIELVTEKDSIGNAFYFKVNGTPVFMKGANYIPQDVFLTRVDSNKYQHILQSAKDANMNMLRVWGGGIYENDAFYDKCDEMGLLVWQDFMFACAMFPGDSSFLNNVKQEAIDNVKRLRNHPSIALWCGNNEILSAWENWGWKNKAIEEQSEEVANTIWKAYDDIFHKILPEVVQQYDNNRAYWPSSPGSSFGEKESFEQGDAHYWMVWWGKEPFDNYNKAIPRFMSEYGFQSFPNMPTINKYTTTDDHDIYSEVMKSHQRSSIGNGTIDEYMKRHYHKPKAFEEFIYTSQILQAYGIQTGIEAHRRNRHRCMGSLYWQINDCWPVASWSSIDYYGNWKALHYAVQKSFKTFLITHDKDEKGLNIWVVSDTLTNIKAQLNLKMIDFKGTILTQWSKQITIKGNNASKYLQVVNSELPDSSEAKNTILVAELLLEDQLIADNIIYFTSFKNLSLPKAEITSLIKETKDEFIITLKTTRFAKSVYLSDGTANNFSTNYFDMLPNSSKVVRIKKEGNLDIDSFKRNLKITSLSDSYED